MPIGGISVSILLNRRRQNWKFIVQQDLKEQLHNSSWKSTFSTRGLEEKQQSAVCEACHRKSLCVLTLVAVSFTGTYTNNSCLFLARERTKQSANCIHQDALLMAAWVGYISPFPDSQALKLLLEVFRKGSPTAKRSILVCEFFQMTVFSITAGTLQEKKS